MSSSNNELNSELQTKLSQLKIHTHTVLQMILEFPDDKIMSQTDLLTLLSINELTRTVDNKKEEVKINLSDKKMESITHNLFDMTETDIEELLSTQTTDIKSKEERIKKHNTRTASFTTLFDTIETDSSPFLSINKKNQSIDNTNTDDNLKLTHLKSAYLNKLFVTHKVDLTSGMKIPLLFELLESLFYQPPPGQLLEAWKLFADTKKIDLKSADLQSITAEDLLEMTMYLLPDDIAILNKLQEKIAVIEESIKNTSVAYGYTGFIVTNLNAALSAKEKRLYSERPVIQQFAAALDAAGKTTPLQVLSDEQAKAAFSTAHTILTMTRDSIREPYLNLYKTAHSDSDIFLMKTHADKLIPNSSVLDYIDFKDEYKPVLPAYVTRLWKNIFHEFKAIVDEKKQPLQKSYENMHPMRSRFSYFNKSKKDAFTHLHTDLSSIIKTADEKAPSVLMKEILDLLAKKFNDQKRDWAKSAVATKWLAKQHYRKDEAEEDKQKHFIEFIAKEGTKHHYSRMLAFILHQLSTAGVFDIAHFKPDLSDLHQKGTPFNIALCAKYYPQLNTVLENVIQAPQKTPSLSQFVAMRKRNAAEVGRFNKMVEHLPELKGKSFDDSPKEIKDQLSSLQADIVKISTLIALDENIRELNDQLDNSIKQFQTDLNTLERSPGSRLNRRQ